MKIVFMTSGTVTSSISYRALAFAKELRRKGHQIYIFSPKFDKYSSFKDVNLNEIEGIKIVELKQIHNIPFVLGLIPYIISSFYKIVVLQPDVIHVYKANPITLIGFIGRLFGKKVILDIDDLDSDVMKIEGSSPLMIKLVELSSLIAAKYASAITVASSYLYRKYKANYKDKKIIIISNGAEFSKNVQVKKDKLTQKRKIVFLGNINRKNILEPLFHAIQNLSDLKININVVIVGDGMFLSYFKKLATKMKIVSKIKFLGHIPQHDLSQFIHKGDLGYCYMPEEPTTKACSSMKVFQYLQYGALPIVSNVGDLSKYVSYGKAGYIANRDDLNELSRTINVAFTKDEKWKEKVTNALKMDRLYSWNSLSKKLESFYQKI